MRLALLLFLLPLYAPAQTFTLLVVGTDSFYVAPLDTMRYSLSLREAADSTIILDRGIQIQQVAAAAALHEQVSNCDKMHAQALKESEALRQENKRVGDLLWKAEKKLKHRTPWAWAGRIAAVVAVAVVVKQTVE